MRTIVFSDTHIGAGPLDDCDAELDEHITAFLREQGVLHPPVELIANGDLLDFVQALPYEDPDLRARSSVKPHVSLCFTEPQSRIKLKGIAQAHPNIFCALGDFIRANARNTLVILPGNHDPDFFWSGIRADFCDLLGLRCKSDRKRIRFHLQRRYRPSHLRHVWIEHGNQYDKCNKFTVRGRPRWSAQCPPIFPDVDGRPRLLECVGTQFLHRFLNRLEVSYPFVDNVKPFSRFLNTFGLSALHPRYGTLKAAAAVWSLLRALGATRLDQIGDVLTTSELVDGGERSHPLQVYVETMSDDDIAMLRRCLTESNCPLGDQPLEMEIMQEDRADLCMALLAEHNGDYDYVADDSSDVLGFGGQASTLTLVGGFLEDESAVLSRAAKRLLVRRDVSLVVMGHTHEALVRPQGIMYYNTGCWVRNCALEPGVRHSWALLNGGSCADFPYELTYLEIHDGGPENVRLEVYASR